MLRINKIIALSLLLLFLFPNSSFAGNGYQGSLILNRIWTDSGGLFLSFTTQPTDCGGNYFTAYAYVPNSLGNYKDVETILISAYLSAKKVDIWYITNGNCTTLSSLLSITTVGFSIQ